MMKAIAVFPASRELRLIDQPTPNLTTPTDVRVRILEVGVCGTDKEISTFEYGTPPAGSEYLVLGHESLAEVVAVGPQVTRVRVGDLVVLMVRRPCADPNCIACRQGRQDFCYTGNFTERGIKQAHGFMTEQVVDDEQFFNIVPPELRPVAVLVEPLTIAEKALTQLWQVQKRLPWAAPAGSGAGGGGFRHRAVVLGAGPVGLLGAMALVKEGFATFVYSRETPDDEKAQVAQAIGAHYRCSATVSLDQLAAELGNIDLVYEATGASSLAFETMKVLGTNGVFIFTGVPGHKGPVEMDEDTIMRNYVLKNQILFGTVNANRAAFEKAIRDLAEFNRRWPAAVNRVISRRYAMDQFRDLLLGRAGGIKNVIAISAV